MEQPTSNDDPSTAPEPSNPIPENTPSSDHDSDHEEPTKIPEAEEEHYDSPQQNLGEPAGTR